MITVKDGDFDAFFSVPFNVYGDRSHYVSPMRSDLKRVLSSETNPLFASENDFSFLTAFRDGRPVGRIIVHHHAASNRLHETDRASFGFFDCEDRQETAAALFQAATDWARARGFTELAGGFNLTAMQQCGVQTSGFERAGYTDMVQNPPHIPALLESEGFERFFPMTTFELDLTAAKTTGKVLADGQRYDFAPVTKATFTERMEDARLVLNDGFSNNPMFVPLSQAEFAFQAGEMTAILDPRLSSVLHCNGEPVGVVICIPDLSGFVKATRSRFGLLTPLHFLRFRFNRRRAVIVFYSVASSQHGRGIMGAMLDRTIKALRSAGYRSLGITWIADVNPASLRQMEKIGAKPLHGLHLFKKALD